MLTRGDEVIFTRPALRLVELPSLVALPRGGGKWTQDFTVAALLRVPDLSAVTLAHPASMQVAYASAELRGEGIAAWAARTGMTLHDAHEDLHFRLEQALERAEEWLVDRRPSTRGFYGAALVGQGGGPMYGHVSDEIAVENYCEDCLDRDDREVVKDRWNEYAALVRRAFQQYRLQVKMMRPK